ncbi:hypothetical protein BH11ACT8_BH11ACT8_07460 [soil metagenome]
MTTSDWGELDPAWAGIREDLVELDAGPVRLLRADAAPGVGAGEPQLLVHGLGGSASNWIDVIGGLRRFGPVVALDLPGFGHTPAASGTALTVAGHRDRVLALADALGWDSFTLHGNSMGGLVATLIAAEHPERVGRLVLVAPAFPPTSAVRLVPPPWATLSGVAPMAVRSRRTRALMRLIFTDPARVRPALLDVMAADARPRDEQEAIDHQQALSQSTRSIAAMWLDPRRVYRAIDAVQAPTLLLGGTADALVAARVLRRVLARRPEWTGAVLDGHRHALMLDAPEVFLEEVARWHDTVTSARA